MARTLEELATPGSQVGGKGIETKDGLQKHWLRRQSRAERNRLSNKRKTKKGNRSMFHGLPFPRKGPPAHEKREEKNKPSRGCGSEGEKIQPGRYSEAVLAFRLNSGRDRRRNNESARLATGRSKSTRGRTQGAVLLVTIYSPAMPAGGKDGKGLEATPIQDLYARGIESSKTTGD